MCCVGTPEPTIEWTKDGEKINRRIGEVHYRKWAIILEDLVPADSGHYTCRVCNIHKCISYTTRLEVKGMFPSLSSYWTILFYCLIEKVCIKNAYSYSCFSKI